MMRKLLVIAALAAFIAAPAAAQTAGDLNGTWAFQSRSYGSDRVGAVMSGVAEFTAEAPNRYAIRVLAHELLVNRETGESRLLTARQACTGQMADGQLSVECQMAEPFEGYTPDTFLLQAGETDELEGVLNNDVTVTFSRVR